MFFPAAALIAFVLAAALYVASFFGAHDASLALRALVAFVAGSFGSLAAAWVSKQVRSRALAGLAPVGLAILLLGLIFRLYIASGDPRVVTAQIAAYAFGACAVALIANLAGASSDLITATSVFACVAAANVAAMLLGISFFADFGPAGLAFPLAASGFSWIASVVALLSFREPGRWSEGLAGVLGIGALYGAARLCLDGDWMLFFAAVAGLAAAFGLIRLSRSFAPIGIVAILILLAYVLGTRAGLADPVRGITPESAGVYGVAVAAVGMICLTVFRPALFWRSAPPLAAFVLFFAYADRVRHALARFRDIELFRVHFAVDFSIAPVFAAALVGSAFIFGFRALVLRRGERPAPLPGIAALLTPLIVLWIWRWFSTPRQTLGAEATPLGAASLAAFVAAAAITGFLLAYSKSSDTEGLRGTILSLILFLGALALVTVPVTL